MKPKLADQLRSPVLWVTLAVLVGAILRLGWVMDMEYKDDEDWMFNRSQNIGRTEVWPWLGMPSGVGTLNPGMSVWMFVWLARLFGATDPPGLARTVQLLNVGALALMLYFALTIVSSGERESWLWATVLAAWNPIGILLQRKIWAQSTLPFFSTLMIIGWWRRDRLWGALLWGFLGACLGQVHMSGFFFAAALFLWTMTFQRKRVRWFGWFAGSVLGVLPLIPWMQYLLFQKDRGSMSLSPRNLLHLKFWVLWVTDSLGLDLRYSLHAQFWDFWRYPILAESSTYAVAALHLIICSIAALLLLRWAQDFWLAPSHWRERLIGRESPSAFIQSAALLGFGLLLSIPGFTIHRHYLLIAFPLSYLWLARLGLVGTGSLRVGRTLLLSLCVAELLISISFLGYIHVNGGASAGDYGVVYRMQERSRTLSPER